MNLQNAQIIATPTEEQSGELKQRFKAFFRLHGVDAPFPPDLQAAKVAYNLEWEEADREFQEEGEPNTDPAIIEARAMRDYEQVLGKIVLVSAISGYFGNDSVDIPLPVPAKVRIDTTTESTVKRWCDDWCDPYWEVSLVEPHPALIDVRSLWISGTCRHLDGKRTERSDVLSIVGDAANGIACVIHTEHGIAGGLQSTLLLAGEPTPAAVIEGMIALAKQHTAFVDFDLDGVSHQVCWRNDLETVLGQHAMFVERRNLLSRNGSAPASVEGKSVTRKLKQVIALITVEDADDNLSELADAAAWIEVKLGKPVVDVTTFTTAAHAAAAEKAGQGDFAYQAERLLGHRSQ